MTRRGIIAVDGRAPSHPSEVSAMTTDPVITLGTEAFTARLSPAHGGIISALDWVAPSGRRHALLFSPKGAVPGLVAPNRFGLWPMVPFANRAFGGRVDDGSQVMLLPINDPAMNATIHGFGWQSRWVVEQHEPARITLVHARLEGDDPYRYRAALTLTLHDEQVRLALTLTSLAERVLPFGAGFHPWFTCADDTELAMTSRRELVLGPGYRATGVRSLPDGGPFGAGRPVRQVGELAVSYVDWVGEAVFSTPSTGLALCVDASDSFRHPVLWTPPGSGFVCFEPQSHGIGAPSDAATRAVTPLKALGPGENLEGWMTITPREL
jgi:aldose 1-epimerase